MFPSVTQILQPHTGMDELMRRFPAAIQAAAARGTAVHAACEAVAANLPAIGVSPEHWGYVNSFFAWFANVEEVVMTETRLYDYTLGYHGQFDLLCRMRGDKFLSLWDYKTPDKTAKTWPAQIAAYRHLGEVNNLPSISRGGTIRLRKNGTLPIVNDFSKTYRQDWNVFISCLNVYNAYYRSKK